MKTFKIYHGRVATIDGPFVAFALNSEGKISTRIGCIESAARADQCARELSEQYHAPIITPMLH